MTIDTSGEWWVGTEAADLTPFLKDYAAGGYEVAKVVPAACPCGSRSFEVALSGDEDAVRRACAKCGTETLMLDSAESWDEEENDECACPCEGEVFEIAVGFAYTRVKGPEGEHDAIKWVSVGMRCVECGILGVYADWKIDYEPSEQLLTAV